MSDSITELNKLSSYDSATGNIPDQDGGVHPFLVLGAAAFASTALRLDPATRSSAVTSAVTNAGSAVLPTVRPAGTADVGPAVVGPAGPFRNFFTKKETKHNKKPDNKEPDNKEPDNKENSYDWAKIFTATAATAAVSAVAVKNLSQKTLDVGTKITNTTSVGTNTTSVGTNTTSVGTNTQSDVPIFKSKLEKLKFLIDKHFEKINELI